MTQSAQPVYQPLNAQHHHLTYAAHSNPLAPPVAPLQFYRWVKGPSFPDLTREDESQYMMLKMALCNLCDPGESESAIQSVRIVNPLNIMSVNAPQ